MDNIDEWEASAHVSSSELTKITTVEYRVVARLKARGRNHFLEVEVNPRSPA